MRINLNLQGLTQGERQALNVIAQSATRMETGVLRMAGLMGQDGETSGALWLIRKLISFRRRTA